MQIEKIKLKNKRIEERNLINKTSFVKKKKKIFKNKYTFDKKEEIK